MERDLEYFDPPIRWIITAAWIRVLRRDSVLSVDLDLVSGVHSLFEQRRLEKIPEREVRV
jgi:hypothetical protein